MNNIIIHARNISGLGATILVNNLLETLKFQKKNLHFKLILPNQQQFPRSKLLAQNVQLEYTGYFIKSIARFWELFRKYDVEADGLIVLGDIPLNYSGRSIVFLQNPHVIPTLTKFNGLSILVNRYFFGRNINKHTIIVVQTDLIKRELLLNYKGNLEAQNIVVLRQPLPKNINKHIDASEQPQLDTGLKLFYPARRYQHKNHSFVEGLTNHVLDEAWVSEIIFTTKKPRSLKNDKISYVGELTQMAVSGVYNDSDALLFLSETESFGFPLLEAMSLGKPILAPDLPYVREMCGTTPFYFENGDINSFVCACQKLLQFLKTGDNISYAQELAKFPTNWSNLTESLLELVF